MHDGLAQIQRQSVEALHVSQETKYLPGIYGQWGRSISLVNGFQLLWKNQLENRKITYKMLFQRHERKSFLHRIVSGDEKWIYFKNQKRKKYDFYLAKPVFEHQGQTASARRPSSVFDGTRILKLSKNFNTKHNLQLMINLTHALIKRWPKWTRRHAKAILWHDSVSFSFSKTSEIYHGIIWIGVPFSPAVLTKPGSKWLSPLFPMDYAFEQHHFINFEEVGEWLDEWFATKYKQRWHS